MSTVQQTRPDAEIDYPETDGRPMAETPLHRDVLFLCIDILRRWFAANQNVYVSGNMMLYYERGNPRRWISPDVQVTLGIPREPERRVYKTWVEGKMADLVIEATSRSTQREDEQFKFELYRGLGVAEYYLFDPEGDYLDPPLVGYRLIAGEYRPIEPVGGRLPSDEPRSGSLTPPPVDGCSLHRNISRPPKPRSNDSGGKWRRSSNPRRPKPRNESSDHRG
jgi:Uma2 family endonuclease